MKLKDAPGTDVTSKIVSYHSFKEWVEKQEDTTLNGCVSSQKYIIYYEMAKIYVGIDPSINSSGVCLLYEDADVALPIEFYIIKPEPLTKKENNAQIGIDSFMYITYEKQETNGEDNHENEVNKAANFISIIDKINEILEKASHKSTGYVEIYVCQEGISYGSSIRTKSIFDLAGFNFLLRKNFISIKENLLIATPAEIKKFATGKGNANKEMMLQPFLEKFPELKALPKNDDIADAYWMAQYAKQFFN